MVIRHHHDLFRRRRAFIGTAPEPPANDAIQLDLDDSTLGIDLDTRLRSLCDAGDEPCVVWIEGTWGRAVLTFSRHVSTSEPPAGPAIRRQAIRRPAIRRGR